MNEESRIDMKLNQRESSKGDRFEFHSHSHYSRGTKIVIEGLPSPSDMIIHAKKIGLGGIAIADHDTNKAWPEAKAEAKKQGIVFIPAMEICSTAGHIIGLGLSSPVRAGMTAMETFDAIREQGAVSVAPHPFDAQNWGVRKFMDNADAVEVFNALAIDKIGNMAAERRARRKGKVMAAGSDAHALEMIGTACNIIDAASVDEVLTALRRGNVSFERNYTTMDTLTRWVRERLTASYPQVLSYINTNYSGPKAWFAKRLLNDYVIKGNHGWERLAGLSLAITMAYSAVRVLAYY